MRLHHGHGAPLVLLVLLFIVHGGREAAEATGGGGFVRAQGTRFVVDGSPYYANGFNAYWLMTMAADPAQRAKVTSALTQAAARGLSVARTWAFSDGGGTNYALQYAPGSYNENTFKGLDFVLSEARKNGIKVILSLVNNYDSFGGKKQYVEWARGQGGQAIGSEDDFFTNSLVKTFYKNHVKTMLTRVNTVTGVAYKNDPTILAWELMNEPRCQSDLSGRTIQAWITEMAAHVKSIDGNHMLEAGLEGFYGASSSSLSVNPAGRQVGTDFIANNQIPGIDFATVHSYPDQWLPSSDDRAQLGFLGRWLDAHIADARGTLHKPLLIAEFGKSQRDPGFSAAQRDALFGMVYAKIYGSARSGGPAVGGLFWQLMADGMDSYGDGYQVIFAEAPASTTGVITAQSRKLKMLGKPFARAERTKGNVTGGN